MPSYYAPPFLCTSSKLEKWLGRLPLRLSGRHKIHISGQFTPCHGYSLFEKNSFPTVCSVIVIISYLQYYSTAFQYYYLQQISPYISGRLSRNKPQLNRISSTASRSKVCRSTASSVRPASSSTAPVSSVIKEEP